MVCVQRSVFCSTRSDPVSDLSDSHFGIIGQELRCTAITISSMCKAFEIPYLQ